jgi:hypothetical protein
MTRFDIAYWLRDRLRPTLEAVPEGNPEPEWPEGTAPNIDALNLAYESLQNEMKSEEERNRIVESKLLSISSFVPIAMTIVVAIVTFLTSGKAQLFTRPSIYIVAILGGYVALQLLFAVLDAIKGLARRTYSRVGLAGC